MSEQPSPLYQEILACFERQRPLILAQDDLVPNTPEYLAADEKVDAEGEIYEKLFAKYAEEALAAPTVQHVGELAALWRFHAYDENGEQIGIMTDDTEVQTLFRVIEKLTGVPVPKRPFHEEGGNA